MAGANFVANMPPSVHGYYNKRALIRAKQVISAYDLCQKKSLPEGEGKTVTFWSYLPLAKNTTALTESITNATDFGGLTAAAAKQLSFREVPVTPEQRGDYIILERYANMVSIDQGLAEKTDVVTQQASESIDYILHKIIGQGLIRQRADADTSYQTSGTTTAAGSTTTVVDTTVLTQADDYWNGGFITITSGAQYGKTRQITDFDNGTGTLTCDAFDAAPGSGVTYKLTVGTGIGASTNVSSLAIRRALRELKNQKAMKYEGSYFRSVLDPDLHFDFMDDSDFKNASIYKQNMENLKTNEIGTFAGVKFTECTQLYRETVAGVESDGAGAVHVLPILGREAVGCVNLGSSPSGRKNFQIYIRNWDQLGQPLPFWGSIGWYGLFKGVPLNSCFGVGLMCGATS